MRPEEEITYNYPFIPGQSRSAVTIRKHLWEETPLGPAEQWPVSLRASLNLLLVSDTPMYLAWGNELISFCNDAFSEYCDKVIVGRSAKEIFEANWDVCSSFFLDTKAGRSSVTDQSILEGVDLEYTFSPVFDEKGQPEGVLMVPKVRKNISRIETHFYNLIMEAPMGTAILKGKDLILEVANPAYLKLIGRNLEETLGKPLFDVLPELKDQGIYELLVRVMESGESYAGNEFEVKIIRNGREETAYFNFVYSPFSEQDRITGVTVIANEVTDLIVSRKSVEDTARKLRHMIMQSPIPVAIFRGDDYIIEMANKVMFDQIWRKKPEEVLGKKLFDVFPELTTQKYPELLKKVMNTGISHTERESPALVSGNDGSKLFYLDYEYAPLREDEFHLPGIMVTVNDVTDKVKARLEILESETRLKIAIESAEIGAFDWDIVHADFQYSDRLAYMFGYKDAAKLSHKHFSERIHPEDAALRLKAHAESFETGNLFYEARFIKPDQSICWLRLNGKVFFDEAGTPQRMYGTALDITSQKAAANVLEKEVMDSKLELQAKNEALKLSEERYRLMTEEVQDYAILLLDVDGTVLNWNQGAEKIKGYPEQEIIGKHFNIFYLEEDKLQRVPQQLIQRASEFGRAVHEGWRIRKDRSIFWASTVITALHNSSNEIVGFSKVTRDLTERKIAEDRLQQNNIDLAFQNKELEQFAYIASHDLQEPLRKIQTFSGMLQNNLNNAETTHFYVDKIKSSAQRMAELIKSVLNYSKLSKSVIELEDVDLNELIENIKIDFELLIFEKNARIVSSDLPVVKGIPLQLTQLFSNLMGNSLKFSDKNPEINIASRIISSQEIARFPNWQSNTEYYEITFSDNGIGFEKQYARQIFDMFQRLHDKQSYSGTGIGLALCKRIVENHNGFISATSEIGAGATFFIYLPV